MNEVEKMYENCNFEKSMGVGSPLVLHPFTAEKQLSLIKWIAEYKEECRITYEKEYKWCTQTDWQSSFCYDNFPASLANLVNKLWADMPEEEKAQMKEILSE